MKTKVCSKGTRCIHPDGPELPATEEYFYTARDKADGWHSYCKECCKFDSRKHYSRNGNKKNAATNAGEGRVISKLRTAGVYAEKGAGGHHSRIDVVAWGCVRIEVKTSTLYKDGHFHFSIGRRANAFHSHDLIVLVCIWPDNGATFHVFKPEHPVFYRGAKLKRGIAYIPTPNGRKGNRYGMTLTAELMTEHQDRWDMIEECRLNWRASV
jgi:hypothetical protein